MGETYALDKTFFQMDSQGFFSLNVPERLNMGKLVVDDWVQRGRANCAAIYSGDKQISFGGLKELTNRFGNALKGLGVAKGDRFVVWLPNAPEFMVSMIAGAKIGAVPIPSNILLRERELEHIVNHSESKIMVVDGARFEVAEGIKKKCPTLKHIIAIGQRPAGGIWYEDAMMKASPALVPEDTHKDDPAFMMYTSGTTGEPKGVVHAHRWIMGTGDPIGKFALGFEKGDISGGPSPLTFMYALGDLCFYSFRWGTATAIFPWKFDAEQAFNYLEKHRITIFNGVPTIYRMMLAVKDAESKYKLGSLRRCISSGEPLPAETHREWKERFGHSIIDCLGQTESHIFISAQIALRHRPGSMGKPLPTVEVSVVDDEGESIKAGEVGNLAIRWDYAGLMKGYYKDPERTRAVRLPNNWYNTKDLARCDEDGYFWYVSRSDDVIISAGYRISPAEVESALLGHRAVLESAVVASPDPVRGHCVKAFVVLKNSYSPSEALAQELQDHVKSLIAPFKYPRKIEFASELPKTSSGKILRRELRKSEFDPRPKNI